MIEKRIMNLHEPPNWATASAMCSPIVVFSPITSFGFRLARERTRFCAAWSCRPSVVSKSIPACGLLQQNPDVIARYFQARAFFKRMGAGLVRSLFQHGSEAEEIALSRFIDNHLL